MGPGDEVIAVANTFFATAEGISMTGAVSSWNSCSDDGRYATVLLRGDERYHAMKWTTALVEME